MSAPEPKEIRDAYSDYRSEWEPIRDEAATDMRYVAGDPWDAEDRAQREDAGRPCISLDEISPMLDQAINNVRANKRAIKVSPKGQGANDKDAEKRSNLIMAIEERSNAQNAYITAFEGAIQRSYGFCVLRTEYKDFDSFDQEILIKPIVNPDTVLLNPNYKQPDGSDVSDGFLLDLMTKKAFKDRFGKDAKATDFSGDTYTAPGIADWIKDKYVQVAEYWRIEHDKRKLLLVKTPKGLTILTEDEYKKRKQGLRDAAGKFSKLEVVRDREIAEPRVVQYLTNGLDILDEIPWAGTRVPIIPCFGKEIWMTEAGSAKRKLLSMVRLARDPQMLLAYLATQECEEAGMIPKTPFIGYKGQFESDAETWEQLNQVPHAFAQVDVVVDGATGEVLPIPQRPQYQANFQQWELAKDSASRSIQKAMGAALLPSQALRQNEKSGIALDKIQTSEAMSIFHFTDNYDRFLMNVGWQVNELITPILDTQREMPVTEPDGTRSTMHIVGRTSHPINEQGVYEVQGADGQPLPEDHLHTGKGEFDVTVSSGPSYESQRQKQSEFVDRLLENIPNLPQPGTPAAKVLALGIRMRDDLGPIGDQIAQVFDPPDPSNLPPQAQIIVQQLQGQLQQLQQENSALHLERAGKVLELQNKQTIEAMKGQHLLDAKTMDFITQVVKAELAKGSKADNSQAQFDAQHELQVLGFESAHEAALQTMDHLHDHAMADKNAQNAQALAAQQSAAQPAQQTQPAGAPGQ